MLEPGNAVTTVKVDEVLMAPWKHGLLQNNTQRGLIDAIYPDLRPSEVSGVYLGVRAILAVANMNVGRINNSCLERMPGDA